MTPEELSARLHELKRDPFGVDILDIEVLLLAAGFVEVKDPDARVWRRGSPGRTLTLPLGARELPATRVQYIAQRLLDDLPRGPDEQPTQQSRGRSA